MNISEAKMFVMLCRDASLDNSDGRLSITPFLWSHKGLGKSSAVWQLCRDTRMGFIDCRASQIEGSDLRGFPDRERDKDGNGIRTIYLPPADLPWGHAEGKKCPACDETMNVDEYHKANGGYKRAQSTYCKGELFLDELPRAEDDVIQSSFQLILDRAVGQYMLPAGWHVVAAGNFLEGYQQNGFQDPAWISRFAHGVVTVDDGYMKEFAEYLTSIGGGSADQHTSKIIQFVSFNSKHLTGDHKGDLGFSVQPSPRAWEMVLKVLKHASKYPHKIVKLVLIGLIGMDLANSFERFDISVSPKDIISSGVEPLRKKLDELNRNQICGLVWGMIAAAKVMEKTHEKMDNVLGFISWIASSSKVQDSRDLAVVLTKELTLPEVGGLNGAVIANPMLSKIAAKVTKNKMSWTDKITNNPELAKIMQKVSYGS